MAVLSEVTLKKTFIWLNGRALPMDSILTQFHPPLFLTTCFPT